MKLTLDYTINAVIEVDTDTGQVLRVALNGEDFPVSMPDAYFNDYDESLPEYLPADHPEAVKAVEIVGTLHTEGGYVELPYTQDAG